MFISHYNGHGIKLVRPLSTVDNTRDYARASHSRQWSNYNNYSRRRIRDNLPRLWESYSYCCCSSSCGNRLQKVQCSVVPNRIEMKFGRIVLQYATTERQSDFWYDVTLSRWWPWRYFTQKSVAIWWANARCLRGAYAAIAAANASSRSILH